MASNQQPLMSIGLAKPSIFNHVSQMSVVWPEKYTPQAIGKPTKLNLPGVSTRSALQIANVAAGVTVTKSLFFELEGRRDIIRRQSDTVLLVFGLQGLTRIKCLYSDQITEIKEDTCWLLHPTKYGVERQIMPRNETASFVVTIRREEASQTLREITESFVKSGGVLVSLQRMPFELTDFTKLFDQNISGLERLQLEARCLTMIAATFAAYDEGTSSSLEARVTGFLKPRLADKIALDDVARHIGMNRTKLNGSLRAECGLTVFELLRNLRLSRAKTLKDLGKPMSQIADETGFSSASHLCRVLRQTE